MGDFGGPTLLSIEVPVVAPPVALEDVRPGHREHVPVQVVLDEPLDLLRQLRSGDRDRVLAALESAPRFEAIHVAQTLAVAGVGRRHDAGAAGARAQRRPARRPAGRRAARRRHRLRHPPADPAHPDQRAVTARARRPGARPGRRALRGALPVQPGDGSRAGRRSRRCASTATRIFQVVERELSVARPVWNGHRLLDQFESSDAVMFLDEHLRDRANRSLEHVFSLLVTVLPREPIKVAFRVVHSDDPMLRGPGARVPDGRAARARAGAAVGGPRRRRQPRRGRHVVDDGARGAAAIAGWPAGAAERGRSHRPAAMLPGNLARHDQPHHGQTDGEGRRRRRRRRRAWCRARRCRPACTSPSRMKNVSMAALALYLASRDVGRNSACLTVFCTE